MAKKVFMAPFILASGVGDDTVIGKGSGNAPVDPPVLAPCSFAYWQEHFAEDLFPIGGNDSIDMDDYVAWWYDQMDAGEEGFTAEAYQALNGSPIPDNPWGD